MKTLDVSGDMSERFCSTRRTCTQQVRVGTDQLRRRSRRKRLAGEGPVLSSRFYNKPYLSRKVCEELAEHDQRIYNEKTQIGIEVNLGLEMAQSLIEQINTKWPELLKISEESESESLE